MDSWERVKGKIREAVKDWPSLARSGVDWVMEYLPWILIILLAFLLYWMRSLLLILAILALVFWIWKSPKRFESLINRCSKYVAERFKIYPWSSSLVAILIGAAGLIYFNSWIIKYSIILGGVIAVVTLLFLGWRAYSQDRQVAHQIKKDIEDRFTNATNSLSSTDSSVCTAAIYSLYRLFIDKDGKEYRAEIAQTLCRHIRDKTQKPEYREKHKDRPSNEIQTAIDLLFKEGEEESGNKGIYCGSETPWKDLPLANLQSAFLPGANFEEAHCEKVDFSHTHCEGADFGRAHCEGADFGQAYCTGANFVSARCEGGNFWRAHCEGAYFREAHCEVVDFGKAYCQGANFGLAHCEGAIFRNAHCEGAYFYRAYCQGANFKNTDFRGSCTSGFPHYRASKRLRERVDKETELENVIFAGPLSEKAIQAIYRMGPYHGQIFYDQLKEIIKENEDMEKHSYKLPENVKKGLGKLEDSPELRQIIQKLEEIEKNNSYL